jgi:lipopolysaccharide transport system permease protein
MGATTSKPPVLDLHPVGLKGVDYPGLLWTLVRTDFKSRYHGTMMGFVWALMKPAAMFLVLLAVFSLIFVSDPHYQLNLLVGLFLWDFFSEGTKVGLTSLAAKSYLLDKTRFPRWILVASSLSNALLTLAVVSTVLLAFLAAIGRFPSPAHLLLFLLVLFEYLLVVVGFSLGTSALFLRYRDLNQIWEVVVQAGFFIAPIIYPLGILPERFHRYLYLWPPTPVVQFSRLLLVEGGAPTLRAMAMLTGMALAIFGAGVVLYRRYAPTAAEYL